MCASAVGHANTPASKVAVLRPNRLAAHTRNPAPSAPGRGHGAPVRLDPLRSIRVVA